MLTAAHADNRRAKAGRMAQVLFDNSICAERVASFTPYQWALVEDMDSRLCRRRKHDPISESTRRETLAELRRLELADFRTRLKTMRRFVRSENRRLAEATKEAAK
jgi:uncharacterized protein YciW